MAEFLRNSDAFVWSIESDPRLRSTIVTLVLFDGTPNWEQLVDRFELLSRTMPIFRQRVMPSPTPAPPRWAVDPDFDLAFHLRRLTAPAPATVDTLLEMAWRKVARLHPAHRRRSQSDASLVRRLGAAQRRLRGQRRPGFPMPVYLAGAKVRMQYAFAPTIGAAVNVTLLSYVDTCAIGINMDAAAIPDAEVFYDCLVAGFDDVVALAN
jgi:Wax ester synthase-like Acyl-CoA acyltransferase domain/WS/DGAT C-terminal domain